MQNQTGMGLDRMMCLMQKNAQTFGAIFGVSEKSIAEVEWLKDLKRERDRDRDRDREVKRETERQTNLKEE